MGTQHNAKCDRIDKRQARAREIVNLFLEGCEADAKIAANRDIRLLAAMVTTVMETRNEGHGESCRIALHSICEAIAREKL